MTSTHLFWTWYIFKKLQPANIIESGVFKGQGTWMMLNACPKAKIFSIDPDLSQRIYIDKKVTYFSKDFNLIDWKNINLDKTICFFDDHQNAYVRLQQMKWMGFKKAIFEDNYPISRGDCYSCKKILSKCGFSIDGIEKIEPNATHAEYLMKNIKTYTTLPPLYKCRKTRWGDDWDEMNYPTPKSIFTEHEIEKYEIIKKEANNYTWICYIELV